MGIKAMETLYTANRDDWRAWLEKNHNTEREVWLIYYKKHTGKSTIPYEEAVEEAICFGWIDTKVKRLDEERYAQKYTPRRPRSKWNKNNIERAKKMIQSGRMTESGLKIFNERQEYDVIVETLEIPPDLRNELETNKTSHKNFLSFAPSYRKTYITWINSSKKQETRDSRIIKVVGYAEKNIKQGM
jgi:uncharacterized protein YdeI (YjbR/CyaY-like superfamily)